jgi:sulfur carrier protein
MYLQIIGKPHEIAPTPNLQDLLHQLGYEPQSIAVAIDGQFVPRHQYTTYILHDQQALEVVAPMQGG